MTDLYRQNGGPPAPLPGKTFDAKGNAYTAPYSDADFDMLGFVLAPPKPADTDTQTAEWDADAEAWVLVDRPVEPEPEPDPTANFIPVPMVRQRIEKLGMWEAFTGYLGQFPPLYMKVFSLEGDLLDPTYPDLAAAFDEMQIPQAGRDYILAPRSAGVGDPPDLG